MGSTMDDRQAGAALADAAAAEAVAALVARARAAQAVAAGYGQAQLDAMVVACGWAIMEPTRNRTLAERSVRDTGLGNVADKVTKNHRKTLGLLRDLKGAVSTGVLAELPELGLTEIARPVGVVCAVVPSTNPGATPANNIINALKCGNAIILSPSPKGMSTARLLLEYMHAALDSVGAPRDLVQMLPQPVTKALSRELMRQCDLVVVTGSQANVRAGYSSGTPALGVGAGNVAVIVDASADLADAAAKIMRSKTFDNATSCSSENSVIIVDAVYEAMVAALVAEGAVMLSDEEKATLGRTMFPDGQHLSSAVTAQAVPKVCAVAGLTRPALSTARCLMVEEAGTGPAHPFSGEKLSPVLAVYRASDFDHALSILRDIYAFMGNGHSCGIHTKDDAHIDRLGREMTVCRVIVNQAHAIANGGSFDNGLPFSLTMGCGTWGRNSFSENLNYRHFMNTTRVVRTIEAREPGLEEIFGGHWARHGRG